MTYEPICIEKFLLFKKVYLKDYYSNTKTYYFIVKNYDGYLDIRYSNEFNSRLSVKRIISDLKYNIEINRVLFEMLVARYPEYMI